MTHRRTGRRTRIPGIAAAAAVLLSAVVGFFWPAQALASGTPRATVSVRVTTVAPGRAPAAAACRAFSRTNLCFLAHVKYVLLIDNRLVGFATFTVTHDLQLNPRGPDYSEQVSIGHLVVVNASGVHVALADGCGITCTPTGNNFPVGETLRNGLHGTLTFHDSVGKGHEQGLRNQYQWLFVKAGFPPASVTYFTLDFYRCDFAISSVPGCVFPQFIPTMTQMRRLPEIRANIRRIQAHGLHLGRFGDRRPLHREASRAQQIRNRNAVCARRVVGPAPPGTSCDEYPFASSKEGGTHSPKNSRGTAFVATHEQGSQAGLISSFYQAERVLDGDAFWVSV